MAYQECLVGDHTPVEAHEGSSVGEEWAVECAIADLEWVGQLVKGLLGDWALFGIRRLWRLAFVGGSLDPRFCSGAELGREHSLIVGVLREEPVLGPGE